jgi:hypothetical protein
MIKGKTGRVIRKREPFNTREGIQCKASFLVGLNSLMGKKFGQKRRKEMNSLTLFLFSCC